jgi:hypothetical protein
MTRLYDSDVALVRVLVVLGFLLWLPTDVYLRQAADGLVSAAWSSWTLRIYSSLPSSLASGPPKCDIFTLWTIKVLYVAVQV